MTKTRIDPPTQGRRTSALRSSSITTGPLRGTLLLLALPVLCEQILNTFVALFDTWLAGRMSAAATSAVGLSAYVGWLASMIMMLVGTGTTALVSRHEGAGEHADANWCANQSMTLAAILGLFLSGFLYTLAPWLASYTNMTGEAYTIAVDYLRIDAYGHMFMSLTLIGCAALRGVGNMRTPMVLFAIINTINIAASCTFVYVLDLGVNGIVGGTLLARTIGGLLTLLILVRGRVGLTMIGSELPLVWSRAKRILRIGIPAAADGAIMWTGNFIFLAIIARVSTGIFGQACFAAHIVAVRVEALTYLPAMAWATAAATMIGQSIGAGNPARARRAGLEAALQCGVLSIVMAILFYVGADWIYRQMTVDTLVQATGAGPFRILALLQPFLVASIVFVGGLRGAGDTRVPLLITVVGVSIRMAVGYTFGIVLGWGLLGAWMGMFGDIIWRAIAATIRYVNGRWLTTDV